MENQINENKDHHFHNPFSCDRRKNVLSAIINVRSLVDRQSGTAICKTCGNLIAYPQAVFTYHSVLTWLYAPIIVLISVYFSHKIGPIYDKDAKMLIESLGGVVLSTCVLMTFLCVIVPAVIMTYLPWRIVPVRIYDERRALQLERENIRDYRRKCTIYGIISTVLSLGIYELYH